MFRGNNNNKSYIYLNPNKREVYTIIKNSNDYNEI